MTPVDEVSNEMFSLLSLQLQVFQDLGLLIRGMVKAFANFFNCLTGKPSIFNVNVKSNGKESIKMSRKFFEK